MSCAPRHVCVLCVACLPHIAHGAASRHAQWHCSHNILPPCRHPASMRRVRAFTSDFRAMPVAMSDSMIIWNHRFACTRSCTHPPRPDTQATCRARRCGALCCNMVYYVATRLQLLLLVLIELGVGRGHWRRREPVEERLLLLLLRHLPCGPSCRGRPTHRTMLPWVGSTAVVRMAVIRRRRPFANDRTGAGE